MQWYKLLIPIKSFDETEENKLVSLLKSFVEIEANGDSSDIAVFAKLSDDGRNSVYYLSPKASSIAIPLIELYNAVPCLPPVEERDSDGSRFRFVSGDDSFWSRFKNSSSG